MARGKGAIPGVGPAAKGRKRQVKVKAHVRRVPGVGAASKVKAPVPSRSKAPATGRVPGVGPAAQRPAKAPSQGSRRYRRARQGTGGVPGVSATVNPHLAEHRVHRGQQEQVAAEASQRAGNLTSGPVDMARPLAAKPPAVASDTLARVIKGMGTVGRGAALGKQTGPSFSIDTSNPSDVVNKVLTTLSPTEMLTGHTVKDELTGKGALADATKVVKDVVGGAYKIPALRPFLGGAGTLLTAASLAPKDTPILNKGVKTAGVSLPAIGKLPENVLKDALDLPAQAIPSVAVPVMGAVEAAQGRPKRLDDFVKSVKQGDPVYKTIAGTVHELSGDTGQASKDYAAAAKAFGEHPLATALEVSGVKGAVGRGAGAAMRTGALGGRAAEAASTKREPLQLFGRATEQRHYSPDPLDKLVQRTVEKRAARKREGNLRAGADQLRAAIPQLPSHMRPHAQEQLAATERALSKGVENQATGTRLKRGLMRRADEEFDAGYSIQRAARDKLLHDVNKVLPKGAAGDLAAMVVDGTVRHPERLTEDLTKRRATLVTQRTGLRGADLKDNQAQIAQIDKITNDLHSGKVAPEQAFQAAKLFVAGQGKLQSRLVDLGDITAGQARHAKLRPYAISHMDAVVNPHDGVLRSEQGAEITTQQIEDHMRADPQAPNPEQVGFYTHRPTNPGDYTGSPGRRPAVQSKRRTGQRYVEGSFMAGRDALLRQSSREATRSTIAESVNRMVDLVGAKKPSGDYFNTASEAMDAARKIAVDDPHAPELVPFDVAQAFTPSEHLQAIRENVDPHALDEEMGGRFGINVEGATRPGEGGRIVLMPKDFVKQLRNQERVLGGNDFERVARVVSGAFRHTVLPMSTKWIFGNAFEAAIRLSLEGGPLFPARLAGAYRLGRQMLAETDPAAGAQMQARGLGGTVFGGIGRRLDTHTESTQFSHPWTQNLARKVEAVAKAPGPKQIGVAWRAYRDTVLKGNQWMERQTQITALGLEGRKRIGELNKSWVAALKPGSKAMQDLAKDLHGTESQVAYARAIDRVLGRYSKLSPAERYVVQNYAPFVAWFRNAIVFVGTMPIRHPVATGLIAAAFQATDEQRKKMGLSLFAPADARVPGFLQGSVPVGGGKLPLSRYTPFGAFSDIAGTATQEVLPQLSNLRAAFEGLNWKGNMLRLADGSEPDEGTKILLGLYGFAESTVPMLSFGRSVAEKGGSAYDDSTIFSPKTRPGTKGDVGDALAKRLNPLRPIMPSQKQAGGKKVDPATQIARELGLEQAPSRKRKKTSQADQLAKDLGIQP